MTTYSDFKTRVRRELEETGTGSTWSDASLLVWTNDAIYDFASKVKPMFDEQYVETVIGQESYDMPTNTIEVVRLSYEDSFLVRIRENLFFDWAALYSENSTPLRYAIMDDVLYLNPKPAAAGTLRMWRRYAPDDVTGDASTMPFGGKWDKALAYYVKARAFEQTGDFDAMKMNDDLYNRAVQDAEWLQLTDGMADHFWEPLVVW